MEALVATQLLGFSLGAVTRLRHFFGRNHAPEDFFLGAAICLGIVLRRGSKPLVLQKKVCSGVPKARPRAKGISFGAASRLKNFFRRDHAPKEFL